MRCSCAKSGTNCTTKCKCTSCGNGKVTVATTRTRRKRVVPVLTSENVSALQYLLSSGEDIHEAQINSCQHFILEAILFLSLKGFYAKLSDLEIDFVQKEMIDRYQKLLEDLKSQKNIVDENFVRINERSLKMWLKLRVKK